MIEEFLDVLDEHGNLTGQTLPRNELQTRGLWYRSAHGFVVNDRQEVLLQQRAIDKMNWPGLFDSSINGTTPAGEEPLTTLVREAYEEIGLNIQPEDAQFVAAVPDPHNEELATAVQRHRDHAYLYLIPTTKPVEQFTPQPDEVASLRYVPWRSFQEDLEQHPERYVPHTYYPALFAALATREAHRG